MKLKIGYCYWSRKDDNMKVFLGGTCNNTTWRDELIKKLKIDYFNPVVDDWNEEAYRRELQEREICDFSLYTITPKMTGVYSIAEVIDDSNKRPEKTVFCLLTRDGSESFDEGQKKSLNKVGEMVERNGGKFFTNLSDVANYLNGKPSFASTINLRNSQKFNI